MAYGIATVDEGVELRAAGIIEPIIIFTPHARRGDSSAARRASLTPTLGDAATIEAWKSAAVRSTSSIETGMLAPAFRGDDVGRIARHHRRESSRRRVHALPFAAGRRRLAWKSRRRRFATPWQLSRHGRQLLHADNSGAIVRRTRPMELRAAGVFLYGVGSGDAAALQPEPVVHSSRALSSCETRSRRYRELRWRRGRSVAQRRIATIGDGLRGRVSAAARQHRAGAAARHRGVTVAGSVTMDMTMLDVTDCRAPKSATS